jgi:hypothetical protein
MKFIVTAGETAQEKQERLSQWHKHMAWLPVCIGPVNTDYDHRNQFAWLEWVERRRVPVQNYYIGGYVWEYRACEQPERPIAPCDIV